jgi:exopolysaccharide biosynthesis polyprenyl glycosylphosphotransferase
MLQKHTNAKRTLILGTTPLAMELVTAMRSQAHRRYEVIGVVGERAGSGVRSIACPFLGLLDDLPRILAEHEPERIVVALSEHRGRLPVQQLVQARIRRGIVIEDGEQVYERLTGKLAMDSLTPSRFIFSEDFQPSAVTLFAARALSVFAAALGVVFFAPLFALIALAIKFDSDGPVLFIQDRVGLNGIPFQLLKFRTMHPERHSRSEWVRDNHDRITRVGKWLRKFRLDELPQFINILRGDMNLVGPRPHPRSNFEMFALVSRNAPQYGGQIPYYSLRCLIRPGITGWAQVRYRYANDLDEEMEKMRYDLYYVKHLSIWLDLRVLFETVKVVALGHGAVTVTVPSTPAADVPATLPETEAALTSPPAVMGIEAGNPASP